MGKIMFKIGGVDRSTYLKAFDLQRQGSGAAGGTTFYMDKQAGGLNVVGMSQVEFYFAHDSLGNGVDERGRMFGGLIAVDGTKYQGTTELYEVRCQDYNILFDTIVRDVASVKAITLTAGTFAAQVLQLTQIIQRNGFASVASAIDATTGVANLHASMPAVTLPPGKRYGWYIDELCRSAQALNTALRPAKYMGLGNTFGAADVFGGPVLYIYDAALSPTPTFAFSDTPTGSQKKIYPTFTRRLDATRLTQRQQSVHSSGLVATYADATSGASYPNPFINHGLTGNKGYWMEEPVEDKDSSTLTLMEARLQGMVRAKAYPRETIEFDTYERVLPGDVVSVTWSLIPLSAAIKRVVGVRAELEGVDQLRSTITLGARRLGINEGTGEEVLAAPEEMMWVAPLPPGTPAIATDYPTWDEARRQWFYRWTWALSATPAVDDQIFIIGDYRERLEPDISTHDVYYGASTAYAVQVGARNARGTVAWSDVTSGTTAATPAMLPPTVVSVTTPGTYNPAISETEVPYSITASAYGVGGNEATWTENGVARKQWLGFTLSGKLLMSPGVLVSQLKFWAYGYDQTRSAATTAVADFTAAMPTTYNYIGFPLNPIFEDAAPGFPTLPDKWTLEGSATWVTTAPDNGTRHIRFTGSTSSVLHTWSSTQGVYFGGNADNYQLVVRAANRSASAAGLTAYLFDGAAGVPLVNATITLPASSNYTTYVLDMAALTIQFVTYIRMGAALANAAGQVIDLDAVYVVRKGNQIIGPVKGSLAASTAHGGVGFTEPGVAGGLPVRDDAYGTGWKVRALQSTDLPTTGDYTTSGKVTAGGAVDGTITRRFHARGTNAGFHVDEVGSGGTSEGFYGYAQRTGGAGTQKFRIGTGGADKFSVDQNGIVAAAYGYQSLGTANFTFGGFFPALPASGDFHYHTTQFGLYRYTGSAWSPVALASSPMALVYNTASQSTTSGIWQTLAFNEEFTDTDTMHDKVTNNSRITATTAGKYMSGANIGFDSNVTGQRYGRIIINGITTNCVVSNVQNAVLGGNGTVIPLFTPGPFAMNAGDYVQVQAWQNSGGALNVHQLNDFGVTRFGLWRVGD